MFTIVDGDIAWEQIEDDTQYLFGLCPCFSRRVTFIFRDRQRGLHVNYDNTFCNNWEWI